MFLAPKENMDGICQHCGEPIVGNAYRVMSEEQGITLLDMMFAPSVLWKRNGFAFVRRKSILEANKLQLETEEVTLRDPKFSFNAGTFGRSSV